MFVTIVHVQVKREHIDEYIQASRLNHQASVREPGNRRFDVLQSTDDPCRFVLYEAYASSEEAALHKTTAHYRRWRESVAGWMAAPREGISYNGLFPE